MFLMRGYLLVAVAACVGILLTLDPAGAYPGAPQGPGLTIDESFNVQQGVRLVIGLRYYAAGQVTLREVFGDADELGEQAPLGYHLPDHPPLGRLLIGLGHELTAAVCPPADAPSPFITACARTAPAFAFAVLVGMLGYVAGRWYGPASGVVAALAVVLMPRLFGHAHLAALETFIGLTYAAAVLCVAHLWTAHGPPSYKTAGWTGVVFGLALLTKIQAVLLPIPIALWAVWHYRSRAVVPVLIWGGAGLLIFFAGWPWLWFDPIEHLREYFGRTTDRVQLHTWYFGARYADRAVPWHYPAVMFLTTVPVGLHLLGGWGLFAEKCRACRQSREQVLLAAMLVPLLVFSLPGVAVYDGARLFLVVFPLWAVFIGRGGGLVWEWLIQKHSNRTATVALGVFLLAQAYGLVALAPCHLSYYNLFVGGLRGADRLGLEPTYWGDGITRSLLEETAARVPAGATVYVAPVMHQFQLKEMENQSPILRRHAIELRPFDAALGSGTSADARYVLFFRRLADLPDSITPLPFNARLLAEVRREGVQLAALYELPP
jgi:hypothetical protein